MTYMVYRYINRGLYECDKLTFVLLATMKILTTANILSTVDVQLFLKGALPWTSTGFVGVQWPGCHQTFG